MSQPNDCAIGILNQAETKVQSGNLLHAPQGAAKRYRKCETRFIQERESPALRSSRADLERRRRVVVVRVDMRGQRPSRAIPRPLLEALAQHLAEDVAAAVDAAIPGRGRRVGARGGLAEGVVATRTVAADLGLGGQRWRNVGCAGDADDRPGTRRPHPAGASVARLRARFRD